MSHPINYWPKTFFYALGNTPAVCLTQESAPEEASNILLLGCGDPRNILFTIYSIGDEGPFDLDFTCCDVEPAVLARNVLLFSLLADDTTGSNDTKIWNIFYHLYLDQDSLALLLAQSQKLFEMSGSIDTWNNSQYGSFLRMCTQRTLSQLRSYWGWYMKTKEMSNAEKKRSKNNFDSGVKATAKKSDGQHVVSGARSAGPLWADATTPAAEEFRHFWTTGVTTVDPKVIAVSKLPNPTFAYSVRGEVFAVHYGADPVSGFHLAPAFVPTKTNPKPSVGGKSFQKLIDLCKVQFRERGKSLRSALDITKKSGKLVIRFFAGDALALCKSLHYWAVNSSIETGIYEAPWTISQLILDGGDYGEDAKFHKAPLMFNVIDTSNLTDHVGLINILLVTLPLLPRAPSSVLYTETLVSSHADPIKSFVDRVGADIQALSLLLGWAPASYASGFTSHSNIHEILGAIMKSKQYHERISWKIISLGDPIAAAHDSDCNRPLVYQPDQLAQFLFGIYLKMFSSEDMMSKFKNIPNLHDMQEMTLVHYSRGTFAMLMRLVRARTEQNWDKVMDGVHERIMRDRKLMMGLNNYQGLVAQLHLLGVDTEIPVLQPNQTIVPLNRKTGKLGGWGRVPALVCVVLTVPRKALKSLTDFAMEEIGTPTLKAEVLSPHGHNVLYDFHPVFGKVTTTGSKEYTTIHIEEDPLGWSGTSPLTISFWYPSWQLMQYPHETKIAFGIRSTPQTSQFLFMRAYGPAMNIYEALLDDKNVAVARERPHLPGELKKVNAVSLGNFSTPPAGGPVKISPVKVTLDGEGQHIQHLEIRMNVIDDDVKAKLAKSDVTTSQLTPCTIEIGIGTFKHPLTFPLPVNGARAKLRIARTSSYVDLTIGISDPTSTSGFSIKNFPVVMHKNTPLPWNIHRINLSRLPAIDLSNKSKVQWIEPHVCQMLSDREQSIRRKSPGHAQKSLLYDIKDSLTHLLIQYAGLHGYKGSVFALSDPEKGGMYTLIFATDLRLDLATHTIAMDACILPLTPKLLTPAMLDAIGRISGSTGIVEINTVGAETKAWADLTLAFVERCRTWKHRNDCRYLTSGIPLTYDTGKPLKAQLVTPLSVIHHDNAQTPPLCECAPGNASPEFLKVEAWAPFAKHVTRAAISPIFGVSYIEPVGLELSARVGKLDLEALVKEKKKEGCYSCGKDGELMRCARCKMAAYCNAGCQKADWKRHKRDCK